MARFSVEAQFQFLISCIRYSNNGKIDFTEVAKECNIVTKGAAAKRFERLMKAHGIPSGREANNATSFTKRKDDDDLEEKKAKKRKRDIAEEEAKRQMDDEEFSGDSKKVKAEVPGTRVATPVKFENGMTDTPVPQPNAFTTFVHPAAGSAFSNGTSPISSQLNGTRTNYPWLYQSSSVLPYQSSYGLPVQEGAVGAEGRSLFHHLVSGEAFAYSPDDIGFGNSDSTNWITDSSPDNISSSVGHKVNGSANGSGTLCNDGDKENGRADEINDAVEADYDVLILD